MFALFNILSNINCKKKFTNKKSIRREKDIVYTPKFDLFNK